MYNEFHNPEIQARIDRLVKKYSELYRARREAEQVALMTIDASITLSDRIASLHEEKKLHLERIERDTARITQLRTENFNHRQLAEDLRNENDRLRELNRDVTRRLSTAHVEMEELRKQVPNPNFVDSRIAEFQRVVKMLRERGDRWKERCMKRREELTLWASRAFKARKERDEARATIAAQAQVVADQAKRLESVESDKMRYMRLLSESRNEVWHLKADLTRALDARTVQPFKSHPGC